MKKFVNILLFVFIAMTMTQCVLAIFNNYDDGPFPFITFSNKSRDSLCVIADYGYPDTLVTGWAFDFFGPPLKDTIFMALLERNYLFEKHPIIQLFIFKESDFLDYMNSAPAPIETGYIAERKTVLKRYVLTREWLEQHDWTVTYP